ncbi:DNA-packaging protein [Sphingomonas jejuensis]|nr:terminase family protein [Sphingomonas jejuensis]
MLDGEARAEALRTLAPEHVANLAGNWPFWARPSQRPPVGPWRVWLVMAGRGFGKTRMGAEWVRARAEADPRLRVALVGATIGDARQVMVEGESGLLAIAPADRRPDWEPSLRRLTWPGGAQAFIYSAAEPETLRGPQHHIAWADEIGKWVQGPAAWDNLMMGLRLGRWPRVVATTTPRPVPLVRRLATASDVAVTRGGSGANRAHLPGGFLDALIAEHGGTPLGRQELDGELIEDAAGALWNRALLERCRVAEMPGLAARVVVAVDPPASADGDACGIVAAARGQDGTGYLLEDATVSGRTPEGWARAVADAAARHGADRVIAEANNGGEMVRSVLQAADAALPVRMVHATRGKSARAEPVAALYERERVRHVGRFPALEDQLCGMIVGGGYDGPGRSPDRADALVWAMTELMLGSASRPRVRVV